ncbi:hypothetical protein Cme02nite_50420 [Catellatospora methionotrophica]|uniref:Carrier domain-containing protein n=1 Tax=Catellatospora methionotrophica TaxID=121620 RepID=A0A8J3LPV9_9ACTN|nr:acyl carrier protein [Catellatospora methionotrophica]GIG16710.1 hypothetical protein Cme02nite_50420 [Catellatospora methionotrophica]
MADSPVEIQAGPDLDAPADEIITAALGEILELDDVDPHFGFFDLGLTSATALRLVRVLRTRWPDIRIIDVFDNPTVADLAAHLERA